MQCRNILFLLWAGYVRVQADSTACKAYVIVSTRGTTEAQGPSAGFGTMITTTRTFIANGTEYDTVYPATNAQGSYQQGTADILRYVKNSVATCPNQKLLLLGYSQGASSTALALRSLPVGSAEGKAILGVLTIGNPVHKPFRASNVDENGSKSTDMYFGSLYGSGNTSVPDEWYDSGKYLDICFKNDVVCMPSTSALAAAFVPHLLYAVTPAVQELGGNFMTNRLYQAGLSPINASSVGVVS